MELVEVLCLWLGASLLAGPLMLSWLLVQDDHELRRKSGLLGPWLFFALSIVLAEILWPLTAAAMGFFGIRHRWEDAKLRREEAKRKRCPRCRSTLDAQPPDADGVVRRFLCHGCETWYTAAQLEGRA